MVGGGIRKDDGAARISSTNVFAALETLKKKKKSLDKDRKGLAKGQGSSKAQEKEPAPPQVTWVPTPLNKSWADIDDDDDDYFKSVPVLPAWGSAQTQGGKDVMARSAEEVISVARSFS